MNKLTNFEYDIIEFILKKDAPKYLKHMPFLMVDSRKYTGHGSYVDIKDSSRKSAENLTLGKSVTAQFEGIQHGAGFMLYIDKGLVTSLEMFSQGGEIFPKVITNYKID